jgi:hypothetical protein
VNNKEEFNVKMRNSRRNVMERQRVAEEILQNLEDWWLDPNRKVKNSRRNLMAR